MYCELLYNTPINKEIFRLDFIWQGTTPKAGQFFMVRPKRSSVFLGRPLSMENWMHASKNWSYIQKEVRSIKDPFERYLKEKYLESNTVRFMVARRGKGTLELAAMQSGEEAEIIGPLGNSWSDFLPKKRKSDKLVALVGGGIGIAPLYALLCEKPEYGFVFHAGFKKGFKNIDEKTALLGAAYLGAESIIVASETGKTSFTAHDGGEAAPGLKGRIPDFLEPEKYSAVCACGPEAMLKAVAEKCTAANVPCYVSMERHMACGVGACLGCTVTTTKGSRRCCADGPIFPASEIIWL